jgi:hypothetical protein
MKNILLILFVLLLSTPLFSQSENIGKIALSVIMPENEDDMSTSNISKLETKITQILSATGVSATGYNNNFVIYPKFAINETSVVESGLQDITIINCELTLYIKQVDNNLIFSTISIPLKGNGKDKQISITNAISKINVKDPEFQYFIDNGKNKIIAYYELKCDDIITKSESLVKMQDFEQALGLLMTVPEEVNCYNKIQEKSIVAYKAYQNQKCNSMLQDAKTKLATNNYNSTLDILSQIDPSTSCFKESQTLIDKTAAKVDQEEKNKWEFQMKLYDDKIALEKRRIKAIKDIAVAYYKRKPTTVNYLILIR